MIHPLRIHEIFEVNKDAFHTRFRDRAARILRRYEFDIVAMWKAKRRSEPSSFTCSGGLMSAQRLTPGWHLWRIGNGTRSRPLAIGAVSSAGLKIAFSAPPTTPRRCSGGLRNA